MHKFFGELFLYSHYCNQKLAVLVADNYQNVNENTLKLFSHILNAHHIWNSRILQKPVEYGVWQQHEYGLFAEIDKVNYDASCGILGSIDLSPAVQYSNTKGQIFSSTAQDMLFHVINHSTYHRAQMASQLKQSGIEPLNTDYIFYKR